MIGTSTPSAMLRTIAFAAVLGITHGFVTPNVVRSAVPVEVRDPKLAVKLMSCGVLTHARSIAGLGCVMFRWYLPHGGMGLSLDSETLNEGR